MKKVVFLSALCAISTTSTGISKPVGTVPGRFLVKADEQSIVETIHPFRGEVVDRIPQLGITVVQLPEEASEQALWALRRNPNVELAEEDTIHAPDFVPNDPYFSQQWHLTKVQAPLAWDRTVGSGGVIVAILDTGVDGAHPDLSGNMVAGYNSYSNTTDTRDVQGHGTAVAGSAISASNNGQGIASVAWNCRIMPVRVSDAQGYAYDSTIAKALTWAADHGARVANISYGISANVTVKSAAQYFFGKGGVVTSSAGNEGSFDTSADNPYILTISATDQNDALASWSNRGNNIDLGAPGSYIITTDRGGGYGGWQGTSFSAPIVAGAAALVFSANLNLTPTQVTSILRSSADDLGPIGFDTSYGYGRLNVNKAVTLALNTSAPTPEQPPVADTTAPSIQITSPLAGTYVSQNVTVTVSATDNVGVTSVQFFVDGVLRSSSSSAPFTMKWNTRKVAAGSHTLTAKAFDAAGNWRISSPVTVYKR